MCEMPVSSNFCVGRSSLGPTRGARGRARRGRSLERGLDDLRRVEEALVAVAVAAGELVHRSPSTPPAAVLDVKVADKISRAA